MINNKIGIAALVVATLLCSTAAIAVADITTVALRGDTSPEGGSTQYRRFDRPTVSDAAGEATSFFAKLTGSAGKPKGIFVDEPAAAGLTIALAGDPDPISGGAVYRRFGHPSMNSGGAVAFGAEFSGGLRAVVRREGGTVSVVSAIGDAAPGALGGVLETFSHPAMTDGGDVIFRATISGGTVEEGLFRCGGGDGTCSTGGTGTLTQLVVANDIVADRPDLMFCRFAEVAASNFGIAFLAETKADCASGAEPARRGAFRLGFGGAVVTVALEGEASADMPNPNPLDPPLAATYTLIMPGVDIASDGTVALRAATRTDVLGLLDRALFICPPGTCPATAPPEAAFIEGYTSDPDGNKFYRLGPPAVNDAGDMAFKATARGPAGKVRGIWVRRVGGTLEKVVAQGDPVPDRAGEVFSKIFVTEKTARLDISPDGKIAFRAKVRGSGVPRTKDGIFLASPSAAFLDATAGVLD